MKPRPGIAKVVTKVSLDEQPSDFAYWQSQPYQARLEALEQIRQEYQEGRCQLMSPDEIMREIRS